MSGFIAGAIHIFFVNAKHIVERRSSPWPFASLFMKLAVHGDIRIISAHLARSKCLKLLTTVDS